MAKEKEIKEDKKKKEVTPQSIVSSIFKNNKEDHYNYEEEVYYEVSSGSLNFDLEIDGMGPGCHRFLGIDSGGKTSSALQFMKGFLDEPKDRRGVYFKAEGRLGPKIRKRSGVNFVFDPEEWVDGTCLVVESNVYEFCFQIVRELITNKKNKTKYFFVFDSADGLGRREDLARPLEDAEKVAGGALITSTFLKKASLALSKRGHIAIFIGQIRDTVKTSQYQRVTPKHGNSTGGNAIKHYADLSLDFLPRNKDDLITEDNKIVGHWCKVRIIKSNNEKNQVEIRYPIKYGRTGGRSVWVEYEIIDILLMYSVLDRAGSWLTFDKEFHSKLVQAVPDTQVPERIQGVDNLRKVLDEDSKSTKWLFKEIKNLL